jgi:release factor glutamine methyltransferase
VSPPVRAALELAHQAGAHLKERGFEQGRLEAELLLAAVLGLKRLDLYLQFDRPVTPDELDRFRDCVRRRLRREPVQYILGESQFRGLVLRVDRRVLIPRPETEQLVEAVLESVRGRAGLRALDIGTGSGAIALSLAAEAPTAFDRIVATDASDAALDVARGNADRLGLAGRVEFRRGSTWDAVPDGERFDVIVSNPPYVADSEAETLAPEVREWEPAAALFAGPAGTEILEVLAGGAADRLRPEGLLALETGPVQAAPLAERLAGCGFSGCLVRRDLSGRDRVVLATRAPEAQAH